MAGPSVASSLPPMTETQPDRGTATAARVGLQIMGFGSTWMLDPGTAAAGEAAGFAGRLFWACGRGGVLGDVDADVVAAEYGFVEPAGFRALWATRPADIPPAAAAAAYLRAGAAWGARVLAGESPADLTELATLAEEVAAAASPAIGGLFAGWRAFPVDGLDPAGRVVRALHVLREHRGCAHLRAVLASGLSPLESILALAEERGGGVPRAQRFWWPEPYPEVTHLVGRRAEVEALTDRIAGPAYAVLDDAAADRFSELVGRVHAAARGA